MIDDEAMERAVKAAAERLAQVQREAKTELQQVDERTGERTSVDEESLCRDILAVAAPILLAAKDEEIERLRANADVEWAAGWAAGHAENGTPEAEARAERLEAERDRLLNSLHMQNQVTGLIPGALEAFRAVRYAAADHPATEPS